MNQQLKLKKYRSLVHDINRKVNSSVVKGSGYSEANEYANSTLDLIFTDKEIHDDYIKILKYDSRVSVKKDWAYSVKKQRLFSALNEDRNDKEYRLLQSWFDEYALGTIKYVDVLAARNLIDAQQASKSGGYQIIFWWLMAVTSSQLDREVKSQKISLICDFAAAFKITATEMEDIINVLKFVYKESSTLTFQSKEVESVFSELKDLYY